MYLNPKRLEIHKDKVEVHFVRRSQEMFVESNY